MQGIIDDYIDNAFRESFFRSIGHEYVNELLNRAKDSMTNTKIPRQTLGARIGVSRATLSRWQNAKVDAHGDKFFAIQLLVLDQSLTTLPIESNDVMLIRSVMAMIRRVYERLTDDSELKMSQQCFDLIVTAMDAMCRRVSL